MQEINPPIQINRFVKGVDRWYGGHMKTNEIKNIINEINSLTSRNAQITKSGGFFTEEQIQNEKKSWALKMTLRFDYGMEIGTY